MSRVSSHSQYKNLTIFNYLINQSLSSILPKVTCCQSFLEKQQDSLSVTILTMLEKVWIFNFLF